MYFTKVIVCGRLEYLKKKKKKTTLPLLQDTLLNTGTGSSGLLLGSVL